MVTVTVEQAVKILNDALARDGQAINALLEHRVPCNASLAEHPTIQVGYRTDQITTEVGLLGIINGLFGVDDEQWDFIAAEIDEQGVAQRFVVIGT